MKALLKFRPNLQGCELEDRLVPAISNLGVIVLTTGGYVLVSPFAGVAAFPGGSPGGTPIPTSFVMTGSGISSMQPGNSTGIPALSTTAPTGSNGGSAATIVVGSGANDAGIRTSNPSRGTPSPTTRSFRRPASAACSGTDPPRCLRASPIEGACR